MQRKNHHKTNNTIKPFIKWVGGKTQLIPILNTMIPNEYNTYFEPFIGGGALFFSLMPSKAIINDINIYLIDTYKDIASNLTKVVEDLNLLQQLHTAVNDKKLFHKNVIESEYGSNPKINTKPEERERERERETLLKINDCLSSSKFIYLNKTSFNGMYRVNLNGKFNVPYNNKDDLSISSLYDLNNLKNISNYLNSANIQILNKNYIDVINLAQKNDFMFVDPPYDSDTSTFTSYDKNNFLKEQQKELAQSLIEADKRGVKWILTNHNTSLINDLYKNYNKKIVNMNRQINSDASNRINYTDEVIIYNYQLEENQKDLLKDQIFLKSLKATSTVLKEYVSWEKINRTIREIKMKCVALNSLLSKNEQDFNGNFEVLFSEYKKAFEICPFLISKRLEENESFVFVDFKEEENNFDFENKENLLFFIKESGLLENIFLNSNVKDIYSYVFGVEVGMNTSNSQKNKTGIYMEKKIESLLNKYNILHNKQKNHDFEDLKENKRFDFVFKKNDITYYLECNFFNTSGSKINSETERFIKLNKEINKHPNCEFIWVTDGQGWKKQINQIRQAFNEIDHFYNIILFEKFISNL